MVNLCIFGGQKSTLNSAKKLYLTLFGGCELRRPTVARQVIAAREARRNNAQRPSCYFLTIFGGVELSAPLLVDEYLDLVDSVRGGQLTLEEWDREAAHAEDIGPQVHSITIFGGFEGSELPHKDEELDAIALQHHLGTLNSTVVNALALAVGLDGAARRSAVRQAAADTLLRAR